MNGILETAMTIVLVKKLGGRVVVTEAEVRAAILTLMTGEYDPYQEGDNLILEVNESEEI